MKLPRLLFVLVVALGVAGCDTQTLPEAASNDPPTSSPATDDGSPAPDPDPVVSDETEPTDEIEPTDATEPTDETEPTDGTEPTPGETGFKPSFRGPRPKIANAIDAVHLRRIELTAEATAIHLSSTGDSLAVAYRDGPVQLHNLKTWQVTNELKGSKSNVYAISQTPDGKFLVTAGGGDEQGELNLWDLSADNSMTSLPPHDIKYHLTSVAISPDGNQIFSTSVDHARLIGVKDLSTQKFGSPEDLLANWRTMRFSPDGKFAVLVQRAGEAQIVNMTTLEEKKIRAVSKFRSGALAIDANGEGFIVGEYEGKPFRSWDFQGNPRVEYTAPKHGVQSLAVTPDGKYLLGGGVYEKDDPAEIYVWNRETGKMVARWKAHKYDVDALAVTSDGQQVVSVDESYDSLVVSVWSLAEAIEKHACQESSELAFTETLESRYVPARAGDVCISADGNVLYSIDDDKVQFTRLDEVDSSAYFDGATKLLPDGSPYYDGFILEEADESAYLTHVELSADGGALLTADVQHRIRVWDVASRTIRTTHQLHDDVIDLLLVSPDGKSFLSADVSAATVVFRDTQTGETKWQIKAPLHKEGQPRAVRFSADGKFVVVADQAVLKWYDVQDGRQTKATAINIPLPTHVTLAPDGERAAVSGPVDGVNRLSLYAGEKLLWSRENKDDALDVFAFSSDGEVLFNSLGSRNIELRNADDGSVLRKHYAKDIGTTLSNVVPSANENRYAVLNSTMGSCTVASIANMLNAELQAVVAKLSARGVEVFAVDDFVLFDFGDASATDDDFAVLKELKTPFYVRLGSSNLTGAAMAHLHGQTHLIGLEMQYTDKFTDEEFSHIVEAKGLRYLTIDGGQLTDQSMEVVSRFTQLKQLSLSDSEFTGESLRQLKDLKQLRELEIGVFDLTVDQIEFLAELTELRVLDLGYQFDEPTADALQPLSGLAKLEELNLGGNDLPNAAFASVAGLTNLRRLDVAYNQLTADGCKSLANLTKLTKLDLSNNPVADQGLDHLANLTHMQIIDVSDTQIVGNDLKGLEKMTDLRELNLGDLPEFTGLGLGVLANMSRLESLNLSHSNVGDEGLKQLAAAKSIKELYLPPAMTDAGFESIGQMSGLQTLQTPESCKFTGEGWKHLKDLPDLTQLHADLPTVTDAGLEAAGQLKRIEVLNVQTSAVTDDGLSHLVDAPKLRVLELAETAVSDAGLVHLAKIKTLSTLGLRETKTTEEGRKTLEDSNTGLYIRD